jgi:glycosyltransferase involved in cell wall biosynthesis
VRFLGFRKDVDKLLKASDLDVTASMREGLATHVIESLCTGVPSVASRIRGQRDLIQDGVTGFCFASGCADEMADKIVEIYMILKDEEKRKAMQKACVDSSGPYHLENTLREMDSVYRQLLSKQEEGGAE